MKRTLAVAVACLLAAGVVALAGCGNTRTEPITLDKEVSVFGKYLCEDSPSDYIEFRSNDTFTFMKGGQETSGSYVIEEDKVLLSAGSYSDTMTVSGKTITDKDGTKYEKK